MTFVQLADIAERQPFPGYAGRFLHGAGMSVAHWTVAQGSGFPEHAHPHRDLGAAFLYSFVHG